MMMVQTSMLHPILPTKDERAHVPHPLLLLVLRCRRLPLGRAPYSLGSVLALLACPAPHSQPKISPQYHDVAKIVRTLLPTSLLNLCSGPVPHQPIMRLELLHHLMAFVYQGETSRFASTVLCAETEAGYLVLVGFVELGEFLAEFVFGDVGAVRVENVTGDQKD